MDELAYSLQGENAHYGTPPNAAAPGRIPGGSSSGSAVAVQRGEVDFSLGSDTAGSVRVPASWCGLYGVRVTWGRVSLEGARPLSRSFDTVGWFARDAGTLARVGGVLLDGAGVPLGEGAGWAVPEDLWALADPGTRAAAEAALRRAAPALGPGGDRVTLSGAGAGGPPEWLEAFRVLQGREVWEDHGEWVASARPALGPGVRERFEAAGRITDAEVAAAAAARDRLADRHGAVCGGRVLVIPTAPAPPPLRGTPAEELAELRTRALSLTSLAGLCALPQVSLPVAADAAGLPVGLSVVGPRGSDESLLALAVRIEEALRA